jgi:hypothetical protein
MEWVLRLVGTGVDGKSRGFDVIEISRTDGVGDIANLGFHAAGSRCERGRRLFRRHDGGRGRVR